MSAILLLLCNLAICIISMDLALSAVYRRRSHYAWTGYLIVFIATSLGAIFLELLDNWSSLAFSGTPSFVLTLIWRILLKADCAFLLVFIPYFTTWLIAHPWKQPWKSFFFILSALYLVTGIFSLMMPSRAILEITDYFLCFFVIFFCIVVMLKNLSGISDKGVRTMCLTVIITAFSILPLLISGLVWQAMRALSIPLVFIAFGIVIMVFLFLALARQDEKDTEEVHHELSLEDLSSYHITEREFSVIQLIRQGLTNKEIAASLDISVNTVNNHIANVFSKTGVRSRIDLLNLISEGW